MYTDKQIQNLLKRSNGFINEEFQNINYDELIECLHFHEYRYSVLNDPLLSDFDYDLLFNKLKEIESTLPEIRKDSPSQRVSSDLVDDFPTVQHLSPMLSLGNSYNQEDLNDFDKQLKRLLLVDADRHLEYFIEPKFDGGSVALVYENDFLVRAATRGNGAEGNDITANIKSLSSIPLKAMFSKYGIKTIELRGEAIIRKDTFEAINLERQKQDLTTFANPRNAATGGLRMKDPNETKSRGIELFIFQIGYARDERGTDILNQLKSQSNGISILAKLGFKVPNQTAKLSPSIKEVFDFVNDWEAKRDSYPYEIDGMVVKLNDFKLQDRAGFTQHHPRWALAYKFSAKQATTTLNSIEYQIGRTGAITPVAKVEPIPLAGVTISSISLHNEDFIKQKDLKINDQIIIERAGDVIPYVVKSLSEKRSGREIPIVFPSVCPYCNVALVKEENEAAWRCPSSNCEDQQIQKIIFHVSKVAMDIDGFGKSYVEKFYEMGWIKDISDVYNLNYDHVAQLEGFGIRSAEKLKQGIDAAKKNPIQRVLHGFSIHHLGKKASKLIAEKIEHVLDLQNWNEEQYTEIKDIGPKVAKNMIAFFNQEDNLELIKRLEEHGVNLTQTDEDKPIQLSDDAPLAGKTILFTGTLQKMGRKVAQELAEKNGAKNISAVSKNLNILVVGEKAGSKLKKATALGTVEILTEDEFIEKVGANL